MSLDFAIKDFNRKKTQTYPYVLTIALVIAFAEFLIYFSNSLGLNFFIQNAITQTEVVEQESFFSGAINTVYTQFNVLLLVLTLILTFFMVVVTTTTLVISKKRDIAIMKSLGTLPRNLYGFYLTECFLIFLISFILGLIIGFGAFGVFSLIMSLLGYPVAFNLDFFYTPILFASCVAGIFFITGFAIRKIGTKNIISTFSKDIPYNYDASQQIKFIPKWLSSLSYNVKMAVVNTLRRKSEFKRYLLIFSILFLIIFTLGLGSIVLGNSSSEWINKAQGENIIAIGHEEVLEHYQKMYEIYSDPTLEVDKDFNFTKPSYLFDFSEIEEELKDIKNIEERDPRILFFSEVKELEGIYYYENESVSGYEEVGQDRTGKFPIVGINPEKRVQDFETEGTFFTEEDGYDNMTIGDGLAYNFFENALVQSLEIESMSYKFHICGMVIDSFYNGYAGYVDLEIVREQFNYTSNEVNLVLLKLKNGNLEEIKEELEPILENLGADFKVLDLTPIFEKNLAYVQNLALYPLYLIIALTTISIIALYNYQKGGLMDKAKDFLIMKAIGSKNKALKRILFMEALFIIIPAILISITVGMLVNSLFLLERVALPPLYVPFLVGALLFVIISVFNKLSLTPLMKKIAKFSVKDFEIY